jgi:hypothetical protein
MKHFEALLKLPGAVLASESAKIWDGGIRHPSPSFNWIFGNTHLAPFGSTVILWGGSKGGKSVIVNGIIGQLHKDYDDAVAIKYNTEYREKIQTTDQQKALWGIDDKRYMGFETNRPEEVFDIIEGKLPALIQAGLNIKLIVIDSISDILGRRQQNSKTVEQQQIGDEAQTIKDGLKRIKSTLKKYGITLLLCVQERAEFDSLEVRRGNKTKMAGAAYLKHMAEYFIHVAKDETKEGRQDLLKKPFLRGMKDLAGKEEPYAHIIKFKMQDSTVGPKKRVGRFTLDYYKGVINTHEEIFLLGVNRNIVGRPNLRTYTVSDFPAKGETSSWSSREDFLTALKENSQLYNDLAGRVKMQDVRALKEGFIEDFASTATVDPDDTISFGDEDEDED